MKLVIEELSSLSFGETFGQGPQSLKIKCLNDEIGESKYHHFFRFPLLKQFDKLDCDTFWIGRRNSGMNGEALTSAGNKVNYST